MAIRGKYFFFKLKKDAFYTNTFFVLQKYLNKQNINKLGNESLSANSGKCSKSIIRGIKIRMHPECTNSHKLDLRYLTCRNNTSRCDVIRCVQLSRI